MEYNFTNSYYTEIEKAKHDKLPVLLPIGTIEYHGHYLPLLTDSIIAEKIAQETAKEIDAIVLPTIYYGVASYAVAEPQKNTVNVNSTVFENYVYEILKSLTLAGFDKIYILIAHQTSGYMPMTLSCMSASKRVIMEQMEEKYGYGWWGKTQLTEKEEQDIFERISVIRIGYDKDVHIEMDHAGKYESSMLEYLSPNSIKKDRISTTPEWFSKDAHLANTEIGEELVEKSIKGILNVIKGAK